MHKVGLKFAYDGDGNCPVFDEWQALRDRSKSDAWKLGRLYALLQAAASAASAVAVAVEEQRINPDRRPPLYQEEFQSVVAIFTTEVSGIAVASIVVLAVADGREVPFQSMIDVAMRRLLEAV